MRELREKVARVKDFIKSAIKPSSKVGGEVIPVSGNGDVTNDWLGREIFCDRI